MLGEILKLKPKRIVLFPEGGALQVEFEDEKLQLENAEIYGNMVVLRYSEGARYFRVYALLWEEVEFYIKRGTKVEEFRGELMERWERHLKGWNLEEVDDIIGKAYVAHEDAKVGRLRFIRVGEEIKKLKFPPRKNFFAVFKGEHGYKSAVSFLRGFFEGAKVQFRSPTTSSLLKGYKVSVLEDSVVIVNVDRALFRVIFDRLLNGRFSSRNLSMAFEVSLPENVKERLKRFGFRFLKDKLVAVPDLPISFSVESLEAFARSVQNVEDEEAFIKGLTKALSGGKLMEEKEILDELFMCRNPYQDPEGKIITMKISLDEIRRYFGE